MSEQSRSVDLTSSRKVELGASLSKSFDRRAALGEEIEGQSAEKTASRSGRHPDFWRRFMVWNSLGRDDPQHGFDG